jgi:hypothetical protein
MKKPGKANSRKVLLFLSLFVLALAAFGLSGCKTTGEDEDGSDLPWNTPQPWEGAPSIPGLNGMGG